jgi:hypothetical protein
MIEVGEVKLGLPLVAVDAGSAMRLAGSLAALGAVAEAAGWAVSLAVDAADGAISLQVRRGVADGVEAGEGAVEPEPDAGGGAVVADLEPEAADEPTHPSPTLRLCLREWRAGPPPQVKPGRRHRMSTDRVRQEVWTCLREDPSTGPELMQLVGAGRSQIEAALTWLAEEGRLAGTGLGWEARTWRPVERFAEARG